MKINIKQAIVALIMLTSFALFAGANPVHVFAVVIGMSLLSVAAWKMKQSVPGLAFLTVEIPDFTEKSEEETKKMSAKEFEDYLANKERYTSAVRRKETLELIAQLKKEDGDAEKLETIRKQMETLIDEHDHALLELKKASEKAPKQVPVGLKAMLEKHKDDLLALKGDENKVGRDRNKSFQFDIETKASQTPADIGDRVAYAQFLEGTDKIPHRRTYVRDRIRTVPTNKEYIKYRDQATVVRDAQNVAQCGASTHNTKLTWATKDLQTTKVRDMIDICIDMLDDYDFVEGEIRELIETSLELKIDRDFLLADGINPNTTSIDFYSSTFSAAATGADYTSSVQAATIIDLIVVAAAQIMKFGENNSFMADTVFINPKDYTLMKLIKDGDDNYIKGGTVDPRIFQSQNGQVYIDGNILVLPNPNVPENELYIFDSTKAVIYQRRNATLEFSYENSDNFEKEVVTVKAYERLNMLVKTNQQNAFMHVADISAGITAITA